MKLTEHRRTAQGLADLLLYAAEIDDGVLLLQDGALMAAWSYRGPDMASATHLEMAALSARLNSILRLGSGWMVDCDAIRSRAPGYPEDAHFPDPATQMIDDERRQQFLDEGAHFESDYFLALTYLPPAEAEERFKGWMFEGTRQLKSAAKRALDQFLSRVSGFEDVLGSLFQVRRLRTTKFEDDNGYPRAHDDLLRYVRRCINADDYPFDLPEIPVDLNEAYVFDVTQTEGRPLPEFAATKGDAKDHLDKLKEIVSKRGIALEYDKSIAPAQGVSSGGRIRLMPELPSAEEFSVLSHELAHEMLHHGKDAASLPKVVRETQAEAVAFVVCRGVGLETNTAAADYIALYNGDKGTLAKSLSVIQETSAKILGDLFPEELARPPQPRESPSLTRGAGVSGHTSQADHPLPSPQEETVNFDR
jgi:hypothetical protein